MIWQQALFIDALQSLGTEGGDGQGSTLEKGWDANCINSEPHHVAVTVWKSQNRTSHTGGFKSSVGLMSWEGHKHWAAKLHSETFLLLWTNSYIRYKAVENQVLKLPLINCKMFAF